LHALSKIDQKCEVGEKYQFVLSKTLGRSGRNGTAGQSVGSLALEGDTLKTIETYKLRIRGSTKIPERI